jgi:hypothetical protein
VLVELTRLAVGDDNPAALDKAADLSGLVRPNCDRMRQYEDPLIGAELPSPDLFG